MSGPIRSALGPAKANLARVVNESQQHIATRPQPNAAEAEWTAWLQLLENDHARIERTLARMDEYNKRWSAVIMQTPEAKKEDENEEYNAAANGDNGFLAIMEEGYEMAVILSTNIKIAENALKQQPIANPPIPPVAHPAGPLVRLPTNALPEFYGDPVLWPSFWDNFRTAIHENAQLNNIDRFNYLNGCLKGDAKKLIQGYFVTEANYILAINKLRERYGNEERIKTNLRAELRRIAPANKFINSIRQVVDGIERILTQLEQLGEDTNQSFVLSAIEEKMPRWVLIEMEKAKIEAEEKHTDLAPFRWDAAKARASLSKILRLHESVGRLAQADSNPKPEHKFLKREKSAEEARVFMNSEEQRKSKNKNFGKKGQQSGSQPKNELSNQPKRQFHKKQFIKYPCIFCNGDESHLSSKCEKYASGEARQKRLAVLKKCFKCFGDANHENCAAPNLKCANCNGNHKTIVCKKFSQSTPETVQQHTLTIKQTDSPSDVLLMIREISMRNSEGKIVEGIKAFIDPGATRSFITTNLARKLNPNEFKNAPSVKINAKGIFNCDKTFSSRIVNMQLGLRPKHDIYRKKLKFREFAFRTADKITGKLTMIKMPENEKGIFRDITHGREVTLSTERHEAEILLGMEYYWGLITNIKCLPNGLRWTETMLGPMISGKDKTPYAQHIVCCATDEVPLYTSVEEGEEQPELTPNLSDMQKLYGLEGIGIQDSPAANEDERAQHLFDKTIAKNGNRYIVRLPQRPNAPPLPTNKNLCLSRLNSIINKLKAIQDPPNLLQRYDEYFSEHEREEKIEIVPDGEIDGKMVHYLPHQAVYRPDKNKLRIVFDCSAHIRGHPSLNDILYRGPVLLPKTAAVILRWRSGKIVIACDIKAAFLTIDLHPEDRNLTRFLWLRNLAKPPTPSNIKIMRFRRVLFGAVSSPFLLGATIVHHLRHSVIAKQNAQIASEIERSIYMDNILLTAETENEGKEKIKIVREIFSDASMELREFLSNHETVLDDLDPADRIVPRPKFLGINWDTERDTITFKFPNLTFENWTMRKVLRTLNGIFDPLGLLFPATLRARLFFQSLWDLQGKWDQLLPADSQKEWNSVLAEWDNTTISISRHTGTCAIDSTQIHIFCDASEKCYATAIYLRLCETNGTIKTNLLFSKSRITPKNWKSDELTIPKLELLGILIGTRAGNFVKNELQIPKAKMILWSDSEIALRWIGSSERQPTFIANRIAEIRKCNSEFRHVASSFNPADLATRGITAPDLEKAEFWWKGPKWLSEMETEWPTSLTVQPPKDEGAEFVAQFALPQIILKKERSKYLIDPARFSNWPRLILTIMFILRFTRSLFTLSSRNCAGKILQKFSSTGNFLAADFKLAEFFALKEGQRRSIIIQNEKIIRDFALFEDELGIMRSKSRLKWSSLPRDSIEPIFLPKDDKISTLIVLNLHERYFHAGVQFTHHALLQNFCGLSKRTIRQILGQCLECKKRKALPFPLPPFPPYPISRVQPSPIFSHIGLDYLGPTVIGDKDGGRQKLWVLLITCLATRAVWLDGVLNLSAITFLNALRRFIAKRGCPQFILSDNAGNFSLTSKTLDAIWHNSITDPKVQEFSVKEKIQWKFIVPMASWEGGAYERLCGIAKNSFKRAIGTKILAADDMNTLIAEVEGTLNSRPLMPLDDNPDSLRTLRPFDFLHTNIQPSLPPLGETGDEWQPPDTNSSEKMLAQYKNSLRNCNKFWQIWQKEYLNFLKERKQYHHKMDGCKILPRIGEVVIVADDSTPRAYWKLGRIREIPDGEPSHIRHALVQMPNGRILKRALGHLIPLEIGGFADSVPTSNPVFPTDKKQSAELEPSKNRGAKEKAKQKIAQIMQEEEIFHAKFSAREPSPYPFLLLIVFALFGLATANVTLLPYECESHEKFQLIHVEGNCNSKGLVIYAKNAKKFPPLCYTIIACGEKFLSQQTNPNLNWKCGKKCGMCPDWASGCSPAKYPPDGHFNYQIPIFDPTGEIDSDGDNITVLIPTIELYNGRLFSVRQMQIHFLDTYDEQEICIGKENGAIIGTPHYCSAHDCMESGTRFCYYPHHESAFFVTGDGEIPIKAWGNVHKEIKGVKKRKLTCQNCHLKCAPKGITTIFDAQKFKTIEICCKPYCYHLENVQSPATIALSKDILLNSHTCTMQLWTAKNTPLKKPPIFVTCPSQNICSLIECYLCTDLLANPECWPTYAAIASGILFTILIFLCCKICLCLNTILIILAQCCCCARAILKITRFGAKIFWNIFYICLCQCRRKRIQIKGRTKSGENELLTSPMRNKFTPFIPFSRKTKLSTTILVIALMGLNYANIGQGASQFTSFMALEEDCKQFNKMHNQQTNCAESHPKQSFDTIAGSGTGRHSNGNHRNNS